MGWGTRGAGARQLMQTLWQDVVHALTAMRRRPSTPAMAILVLGVGIGATAAVFSIVNGVLLQPLPYKNPSQLVAVWDKDVHAIATSKNFDSFADFRAVAQQATVFADVAVATWAVRGRVLTGHGRARDVLAVPVSEGFFHLLGVLPAYGRTFVADDAQRGCSVVLSDRLWRGPLAGNERLVGQSITLDGRPCTVLGVMSPAFGFYPDAAALWVLITPSFVPAPDDLPVGIFARLKDGVTLPQAQAEVTRLHAEVHRDDAKERGLVPVVYNLQSEFTFLAEADLRTTLWVMLGAVSLVLLIACLNVANLLLAQGFGRERELAVRTALGCGHGRLMRQLLTEGALLAAGGGALGIVFAGAAIAYFRAINPVEMPIGAHVTIDGPVLTFAVAVSLATVLLFALVPAWKASRPDATHGLTSSSRGSTSRAPRRLVTALITGEVALSLILLAGAGLLIQSAVTMDREPLGFQPNGLAVTTLTLPNSRYGDATERLEFFDRLRSQLGRQGTLATSLAPNGASTYGTLHIAGRAESRQGDAPPVGERSVAVNYFEVLGVPLVRGRLFDLHDGASSARVVLINASLAQQYFSGSDPIGHQIRVGDSSQADGWRTIIGIVGTEKTSGSYHQIGWVQRAEVLEPVAQDPSPAMSVAFRGDQRVLERAIAGIEADVAVGDVRTMNVRLGQSLAYPRFRAILLGGFALFSLMLAALGLYGVLREFVSRRTREIGVRMAVGAASGDVVRLIAAQAGRPVIAGLIVGVGGAAVLSRYLVSLLYGVQPANPATLMAASAAMLGVAVVAAALPAWRAVRVDPAIALRSD